MAFVFFVLIFFIVASVVLQSPRLIGFCIKGFLIGISFLTPFWPIVLILYYLKFKTTNSQAATRQSQLDQLNRTNKY